MSARESGADSADSGGGGGGGGGAGFGGFLLGLAVGAAIGFLFAPEAGSGSRPRLPGKPRGVRGPPAGKGRQLGGLGGGARAGAQGGSPWRAGVKRPGVGRGGPPPPRGAA